MAAILVELLRDGTHLASPCDVREVFGEPDELGEELHDPVGDAGVGRPVQHGAVVQPDAAVAEGPVRVAELGAESAGEPDALADVRFGLGDFASDPGMGAQAGVRLGSTAGVELGEEVRLDGVEVAADDLQLSHRSHQLVGRQDARVLDRCGRDPFPELNEIEHLFDSSGFL